MAMSGLPYFFSSHIGFLPSSTAAPRRCAAARWSCGPSVRGDSAACPPVGKMLFGRRVASQHLGGGDRRLGAGVGQLAARRPSRLTVTDAAVTLVSLPDDALLLVIAACSNFKDDPPLFYAVKGLGCVSKGMRQQLYQLRPLVGVQSLAVVQRPAHDPWRVMLLYYGELTEAVMEQAQQGRVHSIGAGQHRYTMTLAPAVARRVVPELLGAGCSLVDLDLDHVVLNGTWASTFGEAAVCSAALLSLSLYRCGLQGPLPELRLPALQWFDLDGSHLTGGLEPLRSCTALRVLSLGSNHMTGGLEPLRGCTVLQELCLERNQLTGDLEPLQGCTALKFLFLSRNQLTGGIRPLRNCTALQKVELENNQLVPTVEDKAYFKKRCRHFSI